MKIVKKRYAFGWEKVKMGDLYRNFLIIIILAVFFTGCSPPDKPNRSPVVKNGVINLQDWSFERDGMVKLNGEWAFYWKQLLGPEQFKSGLESQKVMFLKVPMFWNKSESIQTGKGYGTYRIKVKLKNDQRLMALYMPYAVDSAYTLWINGELISSAGKVGTSREKMIGKHLPQAVIFPAKEDTEIILQVSNYVQKTGGIFDEIRIGYTDDVHNFRSKRLAQEVFVAGSIIMMGLYHLGLYSTRRNDRSLLYFGALCMLIGLRSLFLGEVFINQMFPDINYEIVLKCIYLSQYIGTAMFVLYFQSLFPADTNKRVVQITVGFHAILSAIVIAAPAAIFTYTLSIAHIGLIAIIPYILYVLIAAVIRKREGALLCCIFFVVLALTVINDILFYNNLIATIDMTKFGLFVFIFAQSFLLSTKFSKAFKSVAALTRELEHTQREIVFTLGEIVETRSKETGFHVKRVAEYTKLLALKYGFSEQEAELLRLASPMHDVGKVGISDDILNKPGKLTADEHEKMKIHTTIGYDMLKHSSQKVISAAAIIALQHHEKYNGQGYPNGLKGENIHIYGRLTAIADVFDALATDRVYKKAWELNRIIAFFKEEKGEHFDPILTDLFLDNLDEFLLIREKYKDEKVF